jgi:hypothetical protein
VSISRVWNWFLINCVHCQVLPLAALDLQALLPPFIYNTSITCALSRTCKYSFNRAQFLLFIGSGNRAGCLACCSLMKWNASRIE